MKKTKQSTKKVKGDKLSFRVNPIEDRKIIEYMEKATNGSAFVKDAVKFYIHNIEAGRIKSYWLQSDEERYDEMMNQLSSIDVENPSININEMDFGTTQRQLTDERCQHREELTLDDDFYYVDDLEEYKSANNS